MTRARACRKGKGAGQLGQAEREKGSQDNFPLFSFYKAILKPLPRDFEFIFQKTTKTIIT
jgi:hypothetical protein